MLLAIDIGNTHITVGAFEGEHLRHLWRLATDEKKTADEYGTMLLNCLHHDAAASVIRAVAIGSVVPALTKTFETISKR